MAYVPDLVVFGSGKAGRSGSGVSDRLTRYFVDGDGDGAFLRHTTVVAEAQDGLTPELIEAADYLGANLPIPIFSAAFAAAVGAQLAADLELHPCVVRCRGRDFDTFRVARTKTYLPLVDPARSDYVTLSTGTRLLRRPAYDPGLADRFLIARDERHRASVVCAPRLADLVESAGLRVDFVPAG